MKLATFIIVLFLSLQLSAQEKSSYQTLEQTWNKQFTSAPELVKTYKHNQSKIKKQDRESSTYNTCFMLLKSGDYIIQKGGKGEDISRLIKQIPLPGQNDPAVLTFINRQDPVKFTDYYYMIQALKKGETFNDARDGMSPGTQFPARALNHNDYAKLEDLFSGQYKKLQDIYLEKMKFLFRNNGCTDGMATLRPTIEKNIPESPLKNDILQLYNRYEKIRKGQPAPTPILKDSSGKEYSFKDFLGKVIVVDVWATWCCSCIENMPSFIKLRDEFRDNDKVVFLTVSIDRKNARAKWLKALEANKMLDMLNLNTDCAEQSPFETEYCVPSVPRHFVIDQQGKIVDVYAPHGNALKQIIRNTLKK